MIGLILSLTHREIIGRYRGSMFGLFWSLLNPLFMLAVYTFVFGIVMRSRWSMPNGQEAHHSTGEFAVILFSGLIAFQFFAEVVSLAPNIIISNANYVKKIVFPIQILPVVSAGAALFHAAVSLLVLLFFVYFVFGGIPFTVILTPMVFAPLVIMVVGVAWILSAIGVYFRDMSQIVQPFITATLFLAPIFFQRTSLPSWLQPYLSLNPLAIPVEAFRAVVIFGTQPNWTALGYYSLVAIAVALVGEQFFQKTRRGFADVL
ncbi:MAG TPA: ABC transporter permease [Rhizobiaceae bacterium]|nr:ABC transporter permease [Rhizobiaceae bacterium]